MENKITPAHEAEIFKSHEFSHSLQFDSYSNPENFKDGVTLDDAWAVMGWTVPDDAVRDFVDVVVANPEQFPEGTHLRILDAGSGSGGIGLSLLDKWHVVHPENHPHQHNLDPTSDVALKIQWVRQVLLPQAEVVGFDLFDSLVRTTQDTGCYSKTFQQDINQTLALPDNGFDVVFCSGVMSYVNEDSQALSELCRVCRPGGYVLVSFRGDIQEKWRPTYEQMEKDGKWELARESPSRLYLPGHKLYEDKRLYRMLCWKKCTPPAKN
jgi:SAM-dependent methyltransferase